MKDVIGKEPMGLMCLRNDELGKRVYEWSEKNVTKRELDGLMHPRDKKTDERLLKEVEGSHCELRV